MSKASADLPVFVACDISDNGGEGRLANLYALNKYGVRLAPSEETELNDLAPGKVSSPLISARSRWRNSLSAYSWLLVQMIRLHFQPARHIVVLNYLPLWNFLFFLTVPRWVKIAPITGGGAVNMLHLHLSQSTGILTRFTRNIFIPILYKISILLIKARRLQVVPATLAVADALGFHDQRSRFIETDVAPFVAAEQPKQPSECHYDFITYVGPHPLKNLALTLDVATRLATQGHRIAIIGNIGNIGNNDKLHENISCFQDVTREAIFDMMQQSRMALSLSLEQAGFFTFEASAFGLPVLCLPKSGGAVLPGARLLVSPDELLTPDLATARCLSAFADMQGNDAQSRQSISRETRKVHQDAATFYHQN